jgi:hypothetical protein
VLCRENVAFKGPGVVYMVGGLTYPPGVALLDCFAAERPDLRIVDLPNDTAFAPLPPEHQGNALILVPYSHESLLPLVEHHFGEANHEVVAGKFGQPALHLFELTRDQSSAQRGLLGVVERGNAAPELTARHGPPFVTPPAPPWLRTEWRGSIHVPVADSYELKTNAHELRLDRTLVPPHGRIYLAAGWHEISLETRPTGEDTPVTLAWRRGDSEWQNIEPAILAPSAPTGGLLRRHFSEVLQLSDAQPSGQRPDYTGVEPGVSVEQNHIWSPEKNLHLRVVPSTTEWIGKIAIDSDVPREIKLIGTSPAQLYLDDRLVLDLPRGKREAQTVWRGAGSFSFLLRTVRLLEDSPDYVMRLLWREPGERWTSVPSYRLPDSLPALSRTLEPKDTVTKGP